MTQMAAPSIDSMKPGDFVDHVTTNRYYTVRLYMDTEFYGHVDVFSAITGGLSEAHILETFPAAIARFESASLFHDMTDRLIGK